MPQFALPLFIVMARLSGSNTLGDKRGWAAAPAAFALQTGAVRSGAVRGKVRVKVAPCPGELSTPMVPPNTPVTRL